MSDHLIWRLRHNDTAKHLCGLAADEIERLRQALSQCCAPFDTEPTTVLEGAALVEREFQRRMDLAANAINYYCVQCSTKGTCLNLGRCVARPTKETER